MQKIFVNYHIMHIITDFYIEIELYDIEPQNNNYSVIL